MILSLKPNFVPGFYKSIRLFVLRNKGRTFRQKVFSLMHPTPTSGGLHRVLENLIVIGVLISVVSIILETVPQIDALFGRYFYGFEVFSVVLFSLEYIARVYCICELEQYAHPFEGRLRYMMTISALIDLMAVLPFFIGIALKESFDLRFLRVFRLSRLLKLTRYTGTLNTLLKAVNRERRVLFASAFIMVLLVILTASLGYELEHDAQPDKFDSIPSSMYWAVITLASVGYGDISPVTPLGKLMTMVISFIGIGIFAVPAGLMASAFTDQLRIDRETFENEFRITLVEGKLSLQDQQGLEAEAERLHMSAQDVSRIMEKVKQEMRVAEQGGTEGLSPEIVLERYRQQISHLKTLALSNSSTSVDLLMAHRGLTTDAERAIWQILRKNDLASESTTQDQGS
jgi:voltage-gated potassium channel